jgi:hypothetical protein
VSYLLLNLEGNTSDGTILDSLHKVGGETSNLVSDSLGWHNTDLAQDLLVDVEIVSELEVVLLNELLSGSLHGLSSDSTLHTQHQYIKVGIVFELSIGFIMHHDHDNDHGLNL